MEFNKFTKRYIVKQLNEENVDEILQLCQSNPYYYSIVPPMVTKELILEDLHALPPKMTMDNKYYIGYYSDHLVAVMDLIAHYPNEKTAFIGFFMVNAKDQGKYIGWNMIQDLCRYLKRIGYESVRLGVVKGNEPAIYFWDKNGFVPTGIVAHEELYDIIVYEKIL